MFHAKLKRLCVKLICFLAFLTLVVFLLGLLCLFKIKHYAIDAIPQSGGRGAIVEYVIQVGLATTAFHFCSAHAEGVIGNIYNAAFADGLIETRPAASAFKFGITPEQGIATNGAIIGTLFIKLFEFAGPGPFRAL